MNKIFVAKELASIAKLLTSSDGIRIFYIGGGKYALTGVPSNIKTQLEVAFPKSLRKSRPENGTYTYYVTEQASRKIKEWLKTNRISVGGSPMWDLAPGEMPSW